MRAGAWIAPLMALGGGCLGRNDQSTRQDDEHAVGGQEGGDWGRHRCRIGSLPSLLCRHGPLPASL